MYSSKAINTSIEQVNIVDTKQNISILQPKTQDDIVNSIIYASIKILPFIDTIKGTNLFEMIKDSIIVSSYYQPSILKKTELNNIINTHPIGIEYTANLKTKNLSEIEVLKRYDLCIQNTIELYNHLYSKHNTKIDYNIIEKACQSQFYSIESYYTPSAFNVVVMKIQANNTDLLLSKTDYICAIIENLGDMYNHYSSSNDYESVIKFIHISKYLYRIYYSLYNLTNDENYMNISAEIKQISSFKSEKITEDHKYIVSNFVGNVDINEYIDVLIVNIIQLLNEYLNNRPKNSKRKNSNHP